MAKTNLKEKINGNELDLSLSELTSIPIKEITGLLKVTHIDLSCNLLTFVPADFFKLSYLVKIDFSNNKLEELPSNIGNLAKLQHLDLYNNKLTSLPLTVSQLKNLKWLDLKDNPLEEVLLKVAGECLDEDQCRKCAKHVVAHFKFKASLEEKERQTLLKIEREREAEKKSEDEELKRREKERKKIEKEKKRKEYEAKRAKERNEQGDRSDDDDDIDEVNAVVRNGRHNTKTGGLSYHGVFLAIFMGTMAVCIGLYLYCESIKADRMCTNFQETASHFYQTARTYLRKAMMQNI